MKKDVEVLWSDRDIFWNNFLEVTSQVAIHMHFIGLSWHVHL